MRFVGGVETDLSVKPFMVMDYGTVCQHKPLFRSISVIPVVCMNRYTYDL